MRPLDDFSPFLAAYAQSVPDPLANQYIRWAATELCERTRCWRFVDTIPVSGLEDDIVCTPQHADLLEIEAAWWSTGEDAEFFTDPIPRAPFAMVSPRALKIDPAAPANMKPDAITQAGPNSVIVAPRSAGILKLSMFLKPTKDAMELPDFLFSRFAQPIACGALSWILMVPGQSYTNPDLGQAMSAAFNSVCDRHFNFNIAGQQRAAPRARASYV